MAGKRERLTPVPRPSRARKPEAPPPGAAAPDGGGQPAGPDLSHIAPGLLNVEVVPLADLAFLTGNAVEHPDEQVADLKASIADFQQVEPLVVNRRETPAVVVGGNGRLKAMLSAGYTHAAVCFVDLPPDKADALALALNHTAEGRRWNREAVDRLHATLKERQVSLSPRLAEMMDRLKKERGTKPPAVPKGDGQDAAKGEAAGQPAVLKCPACGAEIPGQLRITQEAEKAA